MKKLFALAFVGVLLFSGMAYALPMYGDHYYELVAGDFTWEEANAAAQLRTNDGVTGQLVAITSKAENDFVFGLGARGYWLGATKPAGD